MSFRVVKRGPHSQKKQIRASPTTRAGTTSGLNAYSQRVTRRKAWSTTRKCLKRARRSQTSCQSQPNVTTTKSANLIGRLIPSIRSIHPLSKVSVTVFKPILLRIPSILICSLKGFAYLTSSSSAYFLTLWSFTVVMPSIMPVIFTRYT